MADLIEYQREWPQQFEEEAQRITQVFGSNLTAIHHIGSTAVPGLLARPVIDILAEVSSLEKCDGDKSAMQFLGYEAMGTFGIPDRRYYRKFNANRLRTHHLHVFPAGSDHVTRHLAFRDYLIAHPEKVHEYAALKRKLSAIDGGDWDSYVLGKEKFVQETELLARDWQMKKGT